MDFSCSFRRVVKHSKQSSSRFRSSGKCPGMSAVLLALLVTTPGSVALGDMGSTFHLEDQFGKARSSAEVGGQVLVLIGGNRRAGKQSREWARSVLGLMEGRPEWQGKVTVLRVADLREIPRPLEPAVVAVLRKKYDQSVLLDWDGDLTGRHEFQSKGANVVVVDSLGSAIYRIAGQSPGDSRIAELEVVLSRTLQRTMTQSEDLDRSPLEGPDTQQTGSPQAAESLEGEKS